MLNSDPSLHNKILSNISVGASGGGVGRSRCLPTQAYAPLSCANFRKEWQMEHAGVLWEPAMFAEGNMV